MRGKLVLVLLCSLALATQGCTTLNGVPINGTPSQVVNAGVKPGKKVRVTLKDESVHEMIVTAVDPGGISGHEVDDAKEFRLAYADMQAMEIKTISGKRTAGLVAGILAGVLVVGTYAFIKAVTGNEE